MSNSDSSGKVGTASEYSIAQRTNDMGQPVGPLVPGWVRRPLPPRTAMRGHYAVVEPVSPEQHGADLFDAYQQAPDASDWTYLSAERPESRAQFQEYLETLRRSDDPLHHAIIDANTGRARGTAALMRIDPGNGVMEVGYITFSPALKRTRIGTEAMYLMMRRAFDELGYRRYEWKCDSLNAPSRSAAARFGFRFEGIFRKAVVYKGRSRDTAWYSITDDEWPAIRAAFELWLRPENFDELGRQRQGLGIARNCPS